MGILRVKPIENISNLTEEKNFAWSFQPLFIAIKFILVDFGHYDGRQLRFFTGFKSVIFTFLGYFLFCLNVVSQITIIYLRWEKRNLFEISSTLNVNHTIAIVNYGVRNIVIHFCLLAMAGGRWRKLWKSVRKMEQFRKPQNTGNYDRFRVLCLLGIFYILIIVIAIQQL